MRQFGFGGPFGLFAAALLLSGAGSPLAEVRYVDVNSTNAALPYISWATAATNIQDAVDAAVAGDEIVVTNGIYATGGRDDNRVKLDKPVTLRSRNGAQLTAIDGGGTTRCVYLTNGASLSGFTLTNGFIIGNGAGVFCQSTNALVSNCVLTRNSAFYRVFIGDGNGGGAYGATLNNCTLAGNSAFYGGGAHLSTLNNCLMTGNESTGGIRNGVIFSSSGGGAYGCALNNCTLSGNSGGGAYYSILNNCIVYFNTGWSENHYSCALNYSCTTPLPTNGVGNITNEPAFVNFAAGNYRLRPGSPCIDAGTNLSAVITNDLDGRPRPLDGNGDGLAAFDMGAYEYRTPLLVWQDSPNPTPPHADWPSAAHTIQDAVDAALAGDEIVVTNGIYASGGRTVNGFTANRVTVDKPLTLRSLNGPQFTSINGGGSVRCVYLTNEARLSGFTLTDGNSGGGGGVYCDSQTAVVSNCVVIGNTAFYGGGTFGGTLNKCILRGNSNYANDRSHGAAGGGAYGGTLNNCTLCANSTFTFSAFLFVSGGGAANCTLNNCTLTGNSASTLAFNFNTFDGGASGCILNNCILFGNTTYTNCDDCGRGHLNGNNWSGDPLFVDIAAGNFRLQSNSPCINAGLNAFAPAGLDLDDNPRIAGVGGTVDIGAYEFQLPASRISYSWLQQYALPTDGSADTTDPDGDGLNNGQEWRCLTDPTNAVSALRLLAPITGETNVIVTWQSAAGVNYVLERGTNLGDSPAFTPLASGIPGQSGTTTYTDTNAVGGGPFFYRVGVGD